MSGHDSGTSSPASIVVTHQHGLRFGIRLGAHEIVVDQPQRGGGEDAGPSPLDLLGASLGSCVALYVHKFLTSRNLPVEGLRIEVSQRTEQNPRRISRFDVSVVLPDDIPAQYRPMLDAVARACPAHNTLAHGATVTVVVEMPSAVSR